MSIEPAPDRTAPQMLAQIQEHRQPINFETARELLAGGVNDATREALAQASQAAWDAITSSDSERVRNIPAIALIEAKEILITAALLSLVEYLEEFNANAVACSDVDLELASLVNLLRDAPAVQVPATDDWALRRTRSL
jgi:hypothetical protein